VTAHKLKCYTFFTAKYIITSVLQQATVNAMYVRKAQEFEDFTSDILR